ncbi:MAG: hypothetical protein MUE96_00685 [Bacteroidia bacterium]|jgi:hypothetical protein|nr:hypothetical protein [Bacteroidia bacterium]
MEEFYDISDWWIKDWIQTIGTREKFFVENPANGKQYYFKESISKYPSEFWSEIIASKLGKMLGFNMLDYNIAVYCTTVGCLCESMIDQTHEELEHGIGLIKRSNPLFKITERPAIYFNEVINSLQSNDFIVSFLEIMVFDALIGNQDRHSENWAVIRSLQRDKLVSNKSRFIRWAYKNYKESGLTLKKLPFRKSLINILHQENMLQYTFAPIYDSGSSLGREVDEARIKEFLLDDYKILRYIHKGESEIRLDGNKIGHFAFLSNIMNLYPNELSTIIKRVQKQFNEAQLKEMIGRIDFSLPNKFESSKLTLTRKELIFRLICTRFNALERVLSND